MEYWTFGMEPGSEAWWRAVRQRGTPLVRACGGGCAELTFIWRDPGGRAASSKCSAVYLDVYSHTPHPAREPTGMRRLGDSDAWIWQTVLPADWRGSYLFVPAGDGQAPPAQRSDRAAMRRWWTGLIAQNARADPLNLDAPHGSSSGPPLSRIDLRHDSGSVWKGADTPEQGEVRALRWRSALLGNERAVWLYRSGAAAPDLPLVILLDGHYWARHMPLFAALDALTEQGALPAAVYLLIDALDGASRAVDLPCSATFWDAVIGELLPQAHAIEAFTSDPKRSLVAGQSFGGLAAVYAVLHYRHRFGLAVSQSGSFWWPNPDEAAGQGWLTRQVAPLSAAMAPATIQAWIEVGCYEPDMAGVNCAMRDALRAAGHTVRWREFRGGHDWFCWRDGLLEGLSALLNTSTRMDNIDE